MTERHDKKERVEGIGHFKKDSGERIEGGGVVRRRHKAREVVLQGLTQHRVESQIRPEKYLS